MTAQQLREKIFAKLDAEFELTGGQDFASSLAAIICSQREALDEIHKQGPMSCADEWPQITAGDALADTDARLKARGVL